jgi:putative tryptophan/tyrosine transport system substrate-binding protein
MRRRNFIVGLAATTGAWPLPVHAQQAERVRRVGILMPLGESDPQSQARLGVFLQMLRQIGWVEGKSIVFEKRFSNGQSARLPALAAQLLQANVDVIVTQAAEPIEALRHATATIPIVMASAGDALGAGYIASLAHPGGNITGLTLIATEQATKRLQLMKELLPDMRRVALLSNANAAGHRLQVHEMMPAAVKLGLVPQSLAVQTTNDIDTALYAAVTEKAQALITMDDPLIESQRDRIVDFALRQRLPIMGERRVMTEAGGMISYGANQIDMWKRAAIFVDKILNGANPADLPVEQPTKFELVINLKSARAIGLTVPAAMLVAADEVIE